MECEKIARNDADPPQPRRKRGRPAVPGGKQAVKIRLDNAVVSFYRAEGPGWQTRINDVLRKDMEEQGTPAAQAAEDQI
jgi:uncharacterized protein (DUF4415 family)